MNAWRLENPCAPVKGGGLRGVEVGWFARWRVGRRRQRWPWKVQVVGSGGDQGGGVTKGFRSQCLKVVRDHAACKGSRC